MLLPVRRDEHCCLIIPQIAINPGIATPSDVPKSAHSYAISLFDLSSIVFNDILGEKLQKFRSTHPIRTRRPEALWQKPFRILKSSYRTACECGHFRISM